MSKYEDLMKQYENPDNIYKPVQIVHSHFPTKPEDMDTYIDEGITRGLGGFVVNVAGPWGTEGDHSFYLNNDDEWKRIRLFIEKCYAKGLCVWLYDESGFPSGAAGQWVYKSNPEEFHVRGAECQKLFTRGGKGKMELIDGEVREVLALPAMGEDKVVLTKAIPLTPKDGSVEWDLPDGDWVIAAFLTKKMDWITMTGVPYVDLLREDVVETFINYTHERYNAHLGEENFRKLEAIFTDEPGVVTHGCSSILNEKYPVVAWTDDFKEEFMERYGYDITKNFACIFFDTDTDYKKVRRDFWKMVARRYARTYFKQIYDWCDSHGIEATGHLYGEETLAMQTGLNGDLFGLMRWQQMPAVDRLYATDPRDVIPEKCVASAAHLYGRKRTMSESSCHFEGSFWHIPHDISDVINSCTYQYVLGINNIASYYDWRGTYQPEERKMMGEYLGRLGAFVREGRHKAPLLVHIPMTGAWERYMPMDHKYWHVGPGAVSPYQCEDEKRLESAFGDTLTNLLDHQLDFDLIDDIGLLQCSADGGRITTGYETFDALVLFDSGYIIPEAYGAIDHLLAFGGKLIVIRFEDTLSEQVNALYKKYNDSVVISSVEEATGKARSICSNEIAFSEDEPLVWCRHNVIENINVYLLHNRAKEDKHLTVTVGVSGTAEVLYPMTGEKKEPAVTQQADGIGFAVNIPAKSGVIVTVR